MERVAKFFALLVMGSAFSAQVFAAAKSFDTPLASLQKGPVHFECYEIVDGGKVGGGREQLKFDVLLHQTPARSDEPFGIVPPENEVVMRNLQRWSGQAAPRDLMPAIVFTDESACRPMRHAPIASYATACGSILFGQTQFERLSFIANYRGTEMRGADWSYKLDVNQDYPSGLVFAKFEVEKAWSVSARAIVESMTYLCQPQ